MQKAVAKYGLAAHLALMAVAPLFLFPFFGNKEIAAVLLWLCLFSAIWILLSPSLLGGEMLRDARRRLMSGMIRDPLFWVLVAVVAVAGVRALNGGIRVAFEFETAQWKILPALMPFLPASAGESGLMPFVAALSASIAVVGCRHALGKSARMMFLLILSVLSGFAALVALYLLGSGDPVVKAVVSAAPEIFSGPGLGFAICFLCSATAVFAVLERRWGKSYPLLVAAVAGNAAASFVFLSWRDAVAVAIAYVILVVLAGLCAWRSLAGVSGVKTAVVVIASLGLACAVVGVSAPGDILEDRISLFSALVSGKDAGGGDDQEQKASTDVRDALSGVALKVWSEHPWTGVGVGAFRFHPRFHLSSEELGRLPERTVAVPNGWLHLIAERGIVGAVLVALPLAFLAFSYFAGVVRCIVFRILPDVSAVLAPLAVAVAVFAAFSGVAVLRVEVLTLLGAILAVSSKSFPKEDPNGR